MILFGLLTFGTNSRDRAIKSIDCTPTILAGSFIPTMLARPEWRERIQTTMRESNDHHPPPNVGAEKGVPDPPEKQAKACTTIVSSRSTVNSYAVGQLGVF